MVCALSLARPVLAVGHTLGPEFAATILAHHRSEAEDELALIVASLSASGIAPREAKVWTPELMVEYYGRGPRDPEDGVVCLASVIYEDRLGMPVWIGVYLW